MERRNLVLVDGGLATELERTGLDLNHPLWSAKILEENPTAIRAIHERFLEAGADLICTATYQASFEGFQKAGHSDSKATDLFQKAAELARLARENQGKKHARVIASLGSYAAFLADRSEYTGKFEVSETKLIEFHRSRIQTLLPHVDGFIFETLPQEKEARTILKLLREFDLEAKTLWFSFSRVEPALALQDELEAASEVTSYGFNCMPPKKILQALRKLSPNAKKPLTAYPNLTRNLNGEKEFSAEEFVELDVKFLGGCCGATPDFIASLAEWRDQDLLEHHS